LKATLKGIKTWQGREGEGYQANLLIDGKKAAFFTEDGNGGAMRWNVFDVPLFMQYVAEQRLNVQMRGHHFDDLNGELDMHAATLVDLAMEEKTLKRWCRTKTVFTLPDTPACSYRTWDHKYSPDVKAALLRKYPAAVIINERFL
jgi:hypothetical protein